MAKPKKMTVLICLLVFFGGVIFFFPLQNLKGLIFQKIFEKTGVLIVAEEIHPLFLGWPGIQIKNVNVTLPAGEDDIELSSKSMSFRLRFTWFFIPSVSLSFDELKGGGDLYLKFGERGAVSAITVEAEEFKLGQIKLPGLRQTIQGTINSDIRLNYQETPFSESKGSLRIQGKGVKFPPILVNNPMLGPPFQIPELEAGDLDVQLKIQDGGVVFQSFKIGSPTTDLSGSLSGEVKLGEQAMDSQVNLTLRFVFTPKIMANPEYEYFLGFIKSYGTEKPGEYALNWNASLREITSGIKALPSKVN
jgi:type II secretion system protein N